MLLERVEATSGLGWVAVTGNLRGHDLSLLQQLSDHRYREGAREVPQLIELIGRMLAVHPDEGDEPPVTLDGQHRSTAGTRGCWHHEQRAEVVRWPPQLTRPVGEIDVDLLGRRAGVAEPVEPRRGMRRPSGRVDDEVRRHLVCVTLLVHDDASDRLPSVGHDRLDDLAGRPQRDATVRRDTRAQHPLDQRPAREVDGDRCRPRTDEIAGGVDVELATEITDDGASVDQVVREAWSEILHDLLAGRQQDVDVFGLRDTSSRLGAAVERVAFDDGDMLERVGEDPSREQSRDARSDHDRVIPVPAHAGRVVPVDGRQTHSSALPVLPTLHLWGT